MALARSRSTLSLLRSFSTSTVARSHVGSSPIPYPSSLLLEATPSQLSLSGPKGKTSLPLPPFVRLSLNDSPRQIAISVEDEDIKHQRAMWGLTRALIANAVQGLTEGFTVDLRLVGVGYRAAVEPDPSSTAPNAQRLNMKLGFAHNVLIPVPEGISAEAPQPTRIVLKGTDKHVLGLFAAKVRSWRKPEPYKGKGIFVGNETIKLKDVKKK